MPEGFPRAQAAPKAPGSGTAAALVLALALLADPLPGARFALASEAADPSEPSPPGAPPRGGTLVLSDVAEPKSLDCATASDGPSVRVCRYLCDTLLDYDRNLEVVPRLAEDWSASDGGRTITFHLRAGVLWHDGTPLKARDVIAAVDRIRDPNAGPGGNLPALFETLVALEAPDDRTIVARYREPFAPAIQAWTRAFVARLGPPREASSPPVPLGTGPFRFVRWDPQQQIVLDANPGYVAGRPRIDRLVYRIIPDARTLALSLETGETDIAGLPPHLAPASDAGRRYRLLRYPGLSLDFIVWNVRDPRGLLADAPARRALSLAFDRAGYIRDFRGGADLPAVSSFHPGVWAHDPSLAPLPFDPNAASALLRESGWRDADGDGLLERGGVPARFTLLFHSGNPDHERIATLVQAALAPLGVQVRLQGLEWKVFLEKVRGRSFEAAVHRWGLDVDPDPYDFFHSSQAERGQNYGGYANAEVDRLAAGARRTLDRAERAAAYHRVERILRDEQPYMFVSHPAAVLGVARRVHGVEAGPAGALGWYPAPLGWWISGAAAPAP